MKLLGDVQYFGLKKSWQSDYYTEISFSLDEVKSTDYNKIEDISERATFISRRQGYKYILKDERKSLERKVYQSKNLKNRIELDYNYNKGLLNVFIKGEDAEEILTSLEKLLQKEEKQAA